MMGVNSLPKTVTQQRRSCDLNPGLTAPESSMLTTRLLSFRFRHIGAYSALVDTHNTIQYNTKFVNRHVAVASVALNQVPLLST